MRTLSFFELSLNFENINEILRDVAEIVRKKELDLETRFKRFKKENKTFDEWYDWQVDQFIDDRYFIELFESTVNSGLVITLHAIFEKKLDLIIGLMCKANRLDKPELGNKHSRKFEYLKRIIRQLNQPNFNKISPDSLKELKLFSDVRNCLAHNEGHIPEKSQHLRAYVKAHEEFFEFRNESLWIISVKSSYIKHIMGELQNFFKLLIYNEKGEVLYQ